MEICYNFPLNLFLYFTYACSEIKVGCSSINTSVKVGLTEASMTPAPLSTITSFGVIRARLPSVPFHCILAWY